MTEAENMSADARLTDEVIALVKSGPPFCFPCLASVMMWPETTIRDAAQVVVGHPDFHVRQRTCYRCERTDDMIVMTIE